MTAEKKDPKGADETKKAPVKKAAAKKADEKKTVTRQEFQSPDYLDMEYQVVNGKKNGPCLVKSEKDTRVVMKWLNYRDDVLEGKAEFYHLSTGGLQAECTYKQGKIEGTMTIYEKTTGKVKSVRTYENGSVVREEHYDTAAP